MTLPDWSASEMLQLLAKELRNLAPLIQPCYMFVSRSMLHYFLFLNYFVDTIFKWSLLIDIEFIVLLALQFEKKKMSSALQKHKAGFLLNSWLRNTIFKIHNIQIQMLGVSKCRYMQCVTRSLDIVISRKSLKITTRNWKICYFTYRKHTTTLLTNRSIRKWGQYNVQILLIILIPEFKQKRKNEKNMTPSYIGPILLTGKQHG